MLNASAFGRELKKLGYRFFTGVPCSFLQHLIDFTSGECTYLPAVNEGEAVAMAAGSYLGGKKAVVLMQNSGLANAVSPLTSLTHPFAIPLLGFVSLRGEQGITDEPQHELMGQITEALLGHLQIPYSFLSADEGEARLQLAEANRSIDEKKLSYFFLVRKNTFSRSILQQESRVEKEKKEDGLPTRWAVLQTIVGCKDQDTVLLAATGKTGRELYEIEDAANHFYMVGSMGCASALGLGLALAKSDKRIVVIDGDGALLMRMGSMANVGSSQPQNLLHILLDNHSYDSTGGQKTVADSICFMDIAAACGYTVIRQASTAAEIVSCFRRWQEKSRLTFLYVRIAAGSKENLGRPQVTPIEVSKRLKGYLQQKQSGK